MSTVPANNFVETLRVNVDSTSLTDAGFRDFVRNSLPVVESDLTYTVVVEFGVHGFHVRHVTYTGNLDAVKQQLKEAHEAFVQELIDSDEKIGDLRGYVPEYANGYPSFGGFEPHEDSYNLTIIDVHRSDEPAPLLYHNTVCKELRGIAGE